MQSQSLKVVALCALGLAACQSIGDTYTDRPTVIYSPLSGVDFLKPLMTLIPPSALLFLLQSGHSAKLSLPLVLDSINGVSNESRRGMSKPADPRFTRLVQLLRAEGRGQSRPRRRITWSIERVIRAISSPFPD